MKTNIGITDKNLKASATILNNLLADEYILYTKTRNYHWNIVGENFQELHKFFETQYDALDISIDDIAERVRSLGHFSLGSLKDFLSVARLSEKGDATSAKKMLKSLLDDHETIIQILRKDIATTNDKLNDAGTADFLTGLLEQHEKMAWMIRAYLG
jgi:starvation-inducible DNA-binding protein